MDPSYPKAMCIFYKDDGVCPEERAQMHAHDFDVGYWPHGEPDDVRRRRQNFLQKVSRVHDCLVCKEAMLGIARVCSGCECRGCSAQDT